jgi:hypothetical protein
MKLLDPSKDIVYTYYFIEERIDINRERVNESVLPASHLSANRRTKFYNHFTSGSATGSCYATYFDSNNTGPNANALFDLTIGTHPSSSFFASHSCGYANEKKKIYRLFAQKLLGNANSVFSIKNRDRYDLIFICIKRNHLKQGIKPGSFTIYGVGSGSYSPRPFTAYNRVIASENYGYLLAGNGYPVTDAALRKQEFGGLASEINHVFIGSSGIVTSSIDRHAKIYYDQGVIVCDVALFNTSSTDPGNFWLSNSVGLEAHTFSDIYITTGSLSFTSLLVGCMQRQMGMEFTNFTKPRTTIYNCVAGKEEFNYSSNPSFVNTFGEIITASGSESFYPTTYISKVGLLGENNEVIAVGNLNKPVKKDFNREITIKVRLDF